MNDVTISGNLTADPEAKSTTTGKAMTTARIAINHRKNDDPEFFNITAFDRAAEQLAALGATGKVLVVKGRLRQRTWVDDETGANRYSYDIVANQVIVAESQYVKPRESETETPDQPIEAEASSNEEVPVF